MAMSRKFDAETRECAVWMRNEPLGGHAVLKLAARKHSGPLLGVDPATLRN